MVQVLYPGYPGFTFICKHCSALVKYEINDIYRSKIFCPKCNTPNEVKPIIDADYELVTE